MPASRNLLAIDLGAESGRGIVGRFDGARVELETVHRFANAPVALLDQLVWDAPGLHREVLQAIQAAGEIASVGVDSWGVDFGLLGRGGTLLGLPRHYRDPHTEAAPILAYQTVPADELYDRTGLQTLRFNTLFQLVALQRDRSPLLEPAERLLMMPDLFHYWLTGIKSNEVTNASTTQLLSASRQVWDYELAARFRIPPAWLGNLSRAGTVLGPIRQQVAASIGVASVPVIAPATHDTASAVVGVPAHPGDDWAYLSSGTWSLLGCELGEPVINESSRSANFTNEGGVDGTTRFLKNIMGLWLVQECRRSFAKSGVVVDYDDLLRRAAEADPFRSLVDPDDATFLLPRDMPAAIVAFCRRTGQPAPESPGQFTRCCLESLALKYRQVLTTMESLTGRRFRVIHVVGGGSQNTLLNQFTADATGRVVVAGPVEATALGNVMMQARGLGLVSSLDEIREVARRSTQLTSFEPRASVDWQEPIARFEAMLKRAP